MLPDAVDVGHRAQIQRRRQFQRHNHADRHGFTVQQLRAEPGFGFQRVTECVTEIEQRPHAVFTLVLGDDSGLGSTACAHGIGAGFAVAVQHRRAILFKPVEKSDVADKAVFHDLGVSRHQFAARQRVQHTGICNDQFRLVESPSQIFAMPRIDAGFTADRAVDLGQ